MDINGVNGQQPSQPTLSLTFTLHEWTVIRTALYEAPMPAKFTTPVIGKLEQLIAQAQQAQAVTAEARAEVVQ